MTSSSSIINSKKEKEALLIQDLCARLRYGVKVTTTNPSVELGVISGISIENKISVRTKHADIVFGCTEVKPYLRPMSSMTEEEKATFLRLRLAIEIGTQIDVSIRYYLDFIYSHHLDMDKGLIAKGLAYVAPKDLYKFDKTEIV